MGKQLETVSDFIWGGSNITADGDCSHEIKRCLLLGRKVMTNLDSILKSRDIILPTKVQLVTGFSSSHVWMWELDCEERWALKNWCFWTVVLEKILESPMDCKEISLEEINTRCSFERMMLKLKLQYFGQLVWRVDSLEKIWCWEGLGAGGEGDDRGWDGWMASPTQWTWVRVNSRVGDGQGGLACLIHWVARSRTRLSDWTELNWCTRLLYSPLALRFGHKPKRQKCLLLWNILYK